MAGPFSDHLKKEKNQPIGSGAEANVQRAN